MTVRIFHDGLLVPGTEIVVTGDEHHYLRRVRRARAGATIEVLDGKDTAAVATLVQIDDRRATATIDALRVNDPPPMLELWLGTPDATACLASITAACELGCTRIVLVRCAYSSTTVPNAARIDRVIRAAMRQCGRPTPPPIEGGIEGGIDGPTPLDALLAAHEIPCGIFAWERLREDLTPVDDALARGCPRRLLVGPEGGITDDEAARCRARGMQPLSLGPWTLRTETAVAAGLARIAPRERIGVGPPGP